MLKSFMELFTRKAGEVAPSTERADGRTGLTAAPVPAPAAAPAAGGAGARAPASRVPARTPVRAPAPVVKKSPFPLLTNTSPRRPTPEGTPVRLWKHQEAMFARCVQIEAAKCPTKMVVRNKFRYKEAEEIPDIAPTPIGIMNDPPGCGKTYVMLSLIAIDPVADKTNVIVVPQNIYAQWETAIKAFFPATSPIRTMYFNSYADVMKLHDERIKKFPRIILVNDAFYEPIAQSINSTARPVRRLIIDEIDTVQERLSTPFPCDQVWLMSASFIHKDHSAVGPFFFDSAILPRIICKCDPVFMEESVALETPAVEIVNCDDADIRLLLGIIPRDIRLSMNGGQRRELIKWLDLVDGDSHKLPMKELIEKYIERTKLTPEEESDLADRQDMYGDDDANVQKYKERVAKVNRYRERLATYTPPDPARTKASILKEDICTRIKSNPDQRWLIFNDNVTSLFELQSLLTTLKITSVMLDGGDHKKIERAISDYKSGRAQVLLLNSMVDGAGINLENTTHLLFTHLTQPRLVEQIVGRAQRFGRTGQLQIICLFNSNEDEELLKTFDAGENYRLHYTVEWRG
jgi:hypothetical protein